MEIDIEYEGQKLSLPVSLLKWGYTYRLAILINNVAVFFEPDEEGSYRAILADDTAEINKGLVEVIIAELEAMRE